MIVSELLDWFAQNTEVLHVDVNDVRDKLIEMGVVDDVEFHFVTMDKGKVRGLLYRYSVATDGETPKLFSKIILPRDMGEETEAWRRLVAVKELLHITDCDTITASSPLAVDNLFAKFSMPPELRADKPEPFDSSYLNDRVQIYFALAVLVPGKPRDKLRELFTNNKLSYREIAEICGVPIRYAPPLMHEGFDSVIGTLIKWEADKQISL